MANNINILAPDELKTFTRDVFRGNYDEAVQVIEGKDLDVNCILDDRNRTMLYRCMEGRKYGENKKLASYLLEKGADPNIKDDCDLNAFHRALLSGDIEFCELFMKYEVEVNSQDDQGYSAFFHFIRECYANQSFKGVPLKKRLLDLAEDFLKRGADPDLKSQFDTCVRDYLCPEIESVRRLVTKYDKMGIEKQKVKEVKKEGVEGMKHLDTAKMIWKEMVPKNGQSDTVQGEMLRAVEKLRDEAQRNGNINFDEGHRILGKYLKDNLIESGIFDKDIVSKIEEFVEVLMDEDYPYTDDDIYDWLCDLVCEYHLHFGKPVPRDFNPELDR